MTCVLQIDDVLDFQSGKHVYAETLIGEVRTRLIDKTLLKLSPTEAPQ